MPGVEIPVFHQQPDLLSAFEAKFVASDASDGCFPLKLLRKGLISWALCPLIQNAGPLFPGGSPRINVSIALARELFLLGILSEKECQGEFAK